MLCLSVVLTVQALLMADGGITALGTNITLIGIVTVVVGYGVFVGLRRVLPKRLGMVAPAAAVGALVSVPAGQALQPPAVETQQVRAPDWDQERQETKRGRQHGAKGHEPHVPGGRTGR